MPAFSLQNMLAERGFRPQAQFNNIVFFGKINPKISSSHYCRTLQPPYKNIIAKQ